MKALERIYAVAVLTLKESARKKVAVGMLICSVLMTLALGLVARTMDIGSGNEMGLAFAVTGLLRAVAAFTWVLALFISVTAIPPEMERRTTYTLFSKPLNRFEFVLGKFLGCCALLALNLAVIGLLVLLMLWRESPALSIALLKNLGTFFVSYTALIALAISATLFLPMAVAALVALGLYFLGSVYGLGLQVAQADRLNPIWRGLGWLVYHFARVATPRVNWLNTDRPLYRLGGAAQASQSEAIAMVLLYSLAVLIIGSIIFSRREL